MSTTKKLRLGPLPKTESVKLTFACPAGLKAYTGHGFSSTSGRFAGLRLCGLGAT